ncbi:MAG: ABC transporter permease [Candidatus Calescibacterium sp.]|nr:ABC transporter permease [Candidatus Calescibacterium sp.]MCX7734281.1 ABC transporter permease [bacterium]MDW8087112.1 ABC transporter permease [Candidatus Calescibacterium sp.]
MKNSKIKFSPFFLSLRYSKGRSPFLRFMNALSILGISIGVGTLIVVLSVMTGVREELRNKILGINPHILIIKSGGLIDDWQKVTENLKKMNGVSDVFPLFVGNAIIRKEELTSSVVIQCIPSEFVKNSDGFRRLLKSGEPFEDNRAVVGAVLSKNLGLEVGDKITIISPYGESTMFGFVPNTTEAFISGIIEVGIFDWDSVFLFLDLKKCDELFETKNWVSSIAVMLKNPEEADAKSYEIQEKLKYPFFALPWTKTQKNLFAAMQLEKIGMTVILTLIILVASFNILSTLAILLRDKSKDIAVLKVFGFSLSEIRRAFLGVGMIIATKGIILGTALGLGISFLISKYKIIHLPEDVYFISTLPTKLKIQDIILSWIIALTTSFISSIIPVQRAIKKEPFEILRKEL